METQILKWPKHFPWIHPSDQRYLSEGQNHLLYFWSVNCPHCEELTERILHSVDQLGLHLTCVHVPHTEEEKSVEVVSKYAEEKNLIAPIVLDQDYEVVTKYKVQGLPSFCLINEEGQ
ncbi:TlpA family protein disulfide reductase [Bacillus stratosphericus]|uniref:TlpA family protein disulfide reductase n=1 Tax=Bacillus stratosphericus TaxID=293386 RepID=UPI001CFC00A5|nr:thioredoxin-like domain-containing protein [Bacillus stratosphericus]